MFAEESEGTDAHIVLFGGTGGELARIFAEIAQQFVEFRGVFFGDGRAKGFGEGLRYAIAAQVGVVIGKFATRGIAQLVTFVVLRLVVEEGDAVHRWWWRQQFEAVGDFLDGHVINVRAGIDIIVLGLDGERQGCQQQGGEQSLFH